MNNIEIMNPSTYFNVPSNVIDELLCSDCHKYLSFPPIHTLPNKEGYICGRCINKCDKLTRNEIYEKIISFLTFPCAYDKKGCLFRDTSDEMLKHESQCQYRTISCPTVNLRCDWTGFAKDLQEHFQQSHSLLVINNNSFELDFVKNYNETLLMSFEDNLVLVKRIGNLYEESVWCSFRLIYDNSEELFYYLKLQNQSQGSTIETEIRSLTVDEEEGIEINYDKINFAISDPEIIIVTFKFLKKGENIPKNLDSKCLEMLSFLKCLGCLCFMAPPIFQCTSGHNLCDDCRRTTKKCSTCAQIFRNFTVEHFTSLLEYPCRYFKVGCETICFANNIRKHEKFCKYSSLLCPISKYTRCAWTGQVGQILQHFKNQHDVHYVNDTNNCYNFSLKKSTDYSDFCIIPFKGNTFIFYWKFSIKSQEISWEVKHICTSENCKSFMYDIVIYHAKNTNLRFYAIKNCAHFSNDICSSTTCLNLHINQVKTLLADDVLSFKVSIIAK